MPQVQAEVPQVVEQAFDGLLGGFLIFPPEQQQQIHVRVGEHLAAAVSAQGEDAKQTGLKVSLSDLGDQGVHGLGQVLQRRLGTEVRPKRLLDEASPSRIGFPGLRTGRRGHFRPFCHIRSRGRALCWCPFGSRGRVSQGQ